jgi:hypothetical protein
LRAKYSITVIPDYLRTAKRDRAFWDRIDVRGPDDCWLWKIETQLTQGGYGAAFYASIHTTANRIAFMLSKGEIPVGKQLRHTCADRYPKGSILNRRCCNPNHIIPGSEQDNSDDMVRQDRWQRQTSFVGEANPNCRITDDQLPDLFRDAAQMSQRKVAEKWGMSKSQVSHIVRGLQRSDAMDGMSELRAAALAANEMRRKR